MELEQWVAVRGHKPRLPRPRTAAKVIGVATIAVLVSLGGSAGASTSSATSAADGVAAARASVKKYSATPTSIGVTEPLSKLPTGKRVFYLQCGVPICKTIGDPIEDASKLLGFELVRADAGLSPQTIGQAYDRAVTEQPDAVLAPAVPAALVKSQLAALAEKKIPVIVWTTADEPSSATGIVLNMDGPVWYARQGTLMADFLTADSKGQAKAVVFNTPDFPALVPQQKAFNQRFRKLCPKCSVETVNVAQTSIGTELPSRVVSYLQQHPDTKYVVMAFGDMAIGVPEAVASAGLASGVQLVSSSGGSVNYNYIKKGQLQVVDVGVAAGLLGWKVADAVSRVLVGDDIAADRANLTPTQLLTKDKLTFDLSQPWPGVKNYEAQFRKLWGV